MRIYICCPPPLLLIAEMKWKNSWLISKVCKMTQISLYLRTCTGRPMSSWTGFCWLGFGMFHHPAWAAGLATKGSCQGPWQEVPWHLGRKMFCYWTTLAGRVLPSPAPWQEDEFFPCHLGRKIFLVLIFKLNFWVPPDLWCCGSVKWSPITEVKQRWAWLVLGWETTPLC